MTGGKFANGAMTGAFIHLFNVEGLKFSDSKLDNLHKQCSYNKPSGDDMKDAIDNAPCPWYYFGNCGQEMIKKNITATKGAMKLLENQ